LLASITHSIKTNWISSQGKFVKRFDDGLLRVHVDIGRTTKHHKHGEVYKAEINLVLPGKHLTASSEDSDVRVALVKAKKILAREIRKYKTAKRFRR